MLNEVVNIVEFGYRISKSQMKRKSSSNIHYFFVNSISQATTKSPPYSPFRQITFQLESLKVLGFSKIIRSSQIVFFTSSLQILPMIIAKLLRTKIVLDINDVNSRVSLRTPDVITRIIRYFFWRPLESMGCAVAQVILINKEEEEKFLTKHMRVHPSKIFVLKTSLEEKQNEKTVFDDFELRLPSVEKKRIVLFLSNMAAFMNKRSAQYIIDELAPQFSEFNGFEDVLFVLAGVGSDAIKPLPSNVVATGPLSEGAVNALVGRADVCIDPAIISGGVKTKIQHYLKERKVIVTTQSGAEGINGYGRKDIAFLTSQIETFSDNLKYALTHLDELKKYAINNYDVYEKQFSFRTFVRQVTELMQKLIEK
jgi:glycosyltransferase involved in cell wall biosynthesis